MNHTIYEPSLRSAAAADPLTNRVRSTWTAGDFGRIALGYVGSAAEFVARLELGPNDHVLDVACGTGNLTIPAARTGATVTGIDIASNLVAQARARAAAEGLSVTVDVGDAEELPYERGQFDATISMFGAMFAARPERASAELLRVTRSGRRVAMANWTPDGFIGQVLKAHVRYVPPPPDIPSPLLWGTESLVRQRLGSGCSSLALTRRTATFEYPFPPEQVVAEFERWYGPTVRVFAALDEPTAAQLRHELVTLWWEHNRAVDGTTRVESEYLEIVAVVR
jgi:SAM-dependent methyltransferase